MITLDGSDRPQVRPVVHGFIASGSPVIGVMLAADEHPLDFRTPETIIESMRTWLRYIDLKPVMALTWIWASISHSGRGSGAAR